MFPWALAVEGGRARATGSQSQGDRPSRSRDHPSSPSSPRSSRSADRGSRAIRTSTIPCKDRAGSALTDRPSFILSHGPGATTRCLIFDELRALSASNSRLGRGIARTWVMMGNPVTVEVAIQARLVLPGPSPNSSSESPRCSVRPSPWPSSSWDRLPPRPIPRPWSASSARHVCPARVGRGGPGQARATAAPGARAGQGLQGPRDPDPGDGAPGRDRRIVAGQADPDRARLPRRPIAEAIRAINRAGRACNSLLHPRTTRPERDRRLTLRTREPLPFWKAIDALCEAGQAPLQPGFRLRLGRPTGRFLSIATDPPSEADLYATVARSGSISISVHYQSEAADPASATGPISPEADPVSPIGVQAPPTPSKQFLPPAHGRRRAPALDHPEWRRSS